MLESYISHRSVEPHFEATSASLATDTCTVAKELLQAPYQSDYQDMFNRVPGPQGSDPGADMT
jgi:hypothetical protein